MLKKTLQKANQNSFMPALYIMAKRTIYFLIPSLRKSQLPGFENQIFVRLFGQGRTGTESIQKKWWKNRKEKGWK